MNDLLKHRLLRTPLEKPALWVQSAARVSKALMQPSLRNIHLEVPRMRAAIARILRPGYNGADVGAHIGMVLSLFLQLSPEGEHMAFEPSPGKSRWLKHKFPEADVRQIALGDTSGQLQFSINETRSAYSGLRPYGEAGDAFKEIAVVTARLDDVWPADRRLHFIKVVVEGAELEVLKGAERLIEEQRPTILFESAAPALSVWGHSPLDTYNLLSVHGYRIRSVAGYIDGDAPLSGKAFESAHEFPYDALKFVAEPRRS